MKSTAFSATNEGSTMNTVWRSKVLFLVCTLSFLSGLVRADTSEKTPANISHIAQQSSYFNILNPEQAAQLLQNCIKDQVSIKAMRRYLGIDPKIYITATPTSIQLRYETFDQFSRPPVEWSREGSKMNDFTSPWKKISSISANMITDKQIGNPLVFTELNLVAAENKTTCIPLSFDDDGTYQPADVFAALQVLAPQAIPAGQDKPSAHKETITPEEPVVIEERPAPATTITNPDESTETQLRELKFLYEKELITDEVYKQRQLEILRNIK